MRKSRNSLEGSLEGGGYSDTSPASSKLLNDRKKSWSPVLGGSDETLSERLPVPEGDHTELSHKTFGPPAETSERGKVLPAF